MQVINKVSDIIYADVAEFLRLDDVTVNDVNTLNTMLGAAKSYISNYTGRTVEELDNYEEFVTAVLILCQDMWDNRTLYLDKNTIMNPTVENILSMHSVNLLPKEELT